LNSFHRLPDNLKGVAFLLIASIGFSVMALLIKLLGQHLQVTQILLVRQLGMLLLVSPAILRNFPGSLRTTRPGLHISRILFALVAMLCGFTAVIHLPLAEATALFFAKSFFLTIFAMLILGEHVGPYRWGAVVVGFGGVIIMLQPGTDNFSIYSLASLAGAAGAAAVMINLRILSQSDSADTILTWSALGVGIAMALPGIYYWQTPTLPEWGLFGGLAIVSYLSQKGNIFAYKYGEASLLASLDYVRLLWATLFGFLVFDQLPGASTWIGAAIVVAAAVFTIYRETRRRKGAGDVPLERGASES
jgi:drug/metabolite transporter (DMT)-like permease